MELPEPHPAEALIVRLLAPQRGEAWVKFRQEMYERQRQRVLEALTEAERASGLRPEDIYRRISNDEDLAELFVITVDAAMRTRWAQKLRALGRVLAKGLHADTGTEVDATEVLSRIVSELDPPHVRALALIANVGRFSPGPVGSTDVLGGWLKENFPGLGPVAHQVAAFLLRNGLVTDPFYVNGVLSITELGTLVLQLIDNASDEDASNPSGGISSGPDEH